MLLCYFVTAGVTVVEKTVFVRFTRCCLDADWLSRSCRWKHALLITLRGSCRFFVCTSLHTLCGLLLNRLYSLMIGNKLSRREKALLRSRAESWIRQREIESKRSSSNISIEGNDILILWEIEKLENRVATLEFVLGWVLILLVAWLEWDRIIFYLELSVDWLLGKVNDGNGY